MFGRRLQPRTGKHPDLRRPAGALALVSGFLSLLGMIRLRTPWGLPLFPFKLLSNAIPAVTALMGAAGAGMGYLAGAPLAVVGGLFGSLEAARHLCQLITAEPEMTPGFSIYENLPDHLEQHMLPHRWAGWMPAVPEPRFRQDFPFWTVPGTERELLCDLWEPAEGVERSGLGFIYLHGSNWYMLDKDVGTRPFFRHLAGQGHVCMDVAYRLAPEVNIDDMLGDAKRAVAWMRERAEPLGVRPDRIVIGDASAGGHLALLAAYAPHAPDLTPEELLGQDLSVRGVYCLYGPTDLVATYYYNKQQRIARDGGLQKELTEPYEKTIWHVLYPILGDKVKRLKLHKPPEVGSLPFLLGGHPDEIPEAYLRLSPVHYIHDTCPPTLIVQGEQDMLVSVEATRLFFNRLKARGVPAVLSIIPRADHMLEVFATQTSPAAHSALYDVERFLAALSRG